MNEIWGEAFDIIGLPEGVMSPDEYRVKYFVPLVASACVDAINTLAPAGLSPELGHAVVGHPRRVTYRNGVSAMYGGTDDYNFDTLEGCNDNGVEMLYVFDEKDDISGIIMSFHCPAQVLEMQEYYSADFVGYFRMQLEAMIGRDIFFRSSALPAISRRAILFAATAERRICTRYPALTSSADGCLCALLSITTMRVRASFMRRWCVTLPMYFSFRCAPSPVKNTARHRRNLMKPSRQRMI